MRRFALKNNIIIGGDIRMMYACEYLNDHYGVFTHLNINNVEMSHDALSEIINRAETVVLPIPLSFDNITVNGMPSLGINDTLNMISDNTIVFGIACDYFPEKRHITSVNYSEDEVYMLEMAYLTAEGAVGHILTEHRRKLKGERVSILGYGRISKALIDILNCFGCEISVVLRNRLKFDENKHRNVKIYDISEKNRILDSEIIINTVPSRIIDDDILSNMNKDTLLIELASRPFGFEFETARKLGINAVYLPGLPGKCAPESAGYALGKTVCKHLNKTS